MAPGGDTNGGGTLTPPPSLPPSSNPPGDSLPTLPFELVEKILCRLPVKPLLRFQCVSKSWNSLISDSKFARKHLREFNRRTIILETRNHLNSYSLQPAFAFTAANPTATTPIPYPPNHYFYHSVVVGSCDGIICLCDFNTRTFLAWNPCTKTFAKSPPWEKLNAGDYTVKTSLGFGYDRRTGIYKAVRIFTHGLKAQVMVHTFGTNSWRTMEENFLPHDNSGKFSKGTINWIGVAHWNSVRFIISLDLGKESFQELRLPAGIDQTNLTLGVLRDSLCVVSHLRLLFWDIWMMKEHGNSESWTKLFSIPDYTGEIGYFPLNQPRYVSEDEEGLPPPSLSDLIVYVLVASIHNVSKIFHFQCWPALKFPKIFHEPVVHTESLTSPCPLAGRFDDFVGISINQ
ncbi:F-box/kelch-repeat protein At3g23880-like [Lotus japonicus]|uniref:F-box/kelch-repeat protein At3g23880-like n=1 Tax=Lotus japonicus TaxID=34305 RepID=UPI00258C47A6|nr:F-box/kelch-repeat protein At3g23880-like [Lotus japonicus]